jgi:hypothetical protein
MTPERPTVWSGMRRAVVAVLALFALWLLIAIVVGGYYAADGGHGGKPSVELVSIALGAVVLMVDAALIRKLWKGRL